MHKRLNLTAALALIAMLAATSAFADRRHRGETDSYRDRSRAISVEGRIRDIDRNRNDFVIRLDRGNSVLVASPRTNVYSSTRGTRTVHQLDRGDVIRATGELDSRGTVYVDTITLLRGDRYDGRYDNRDTRSRRSVAGVVASVDVGRRIVWVREDRTGRTVAIDLRGAQRNDRRWDNDDDRYDDRRDRWNDISRIRRGDRIRARGEWTGNERFEADRYDVTQ